MSIKDDRPVVAIDTETALIRHGLLAPPLVCVSYADGAPGGPGLLLHSDPRALEYVAGAFTKAAAGDLIITGQNFAYDAAVFLVRWPELVGVVFAAYDAGGVHDTMLQERLLDLAVGDLGFHFDADGARRRVWYSLDAIVQRRFGRALDKGIDGWRMRYASLANTPLAQWPERAQEYARDDATITRRLYLDQIERAAHGAHPDVLYDSPAQSRAALALHLMACRGMRTDPKTIGALSAQYTHAKDTAFEVLQSAGVVGARGSITQQPIRDLVFDALGHTAPTTPKGSISIAAEVLKQIDNPVLQAHVRYKKAQKMLGTYVDKLWHGVDYPIQPRVNSLLETGRTSMGAWAGLPKGARGFSLQTVPPKIRPAFIPRPGFEFVATDYATAELRSLGQVVLNLFGRSEFAELFQRDARADPHLEFGAAMAGVSVADARAAHARGEFPQRKDAKAANFGFPGGMGVARFVATERKKWFEHDGAQGGLYTDSDAWTLRNAWLDRWALGDYFEHISSATDLGPAVFRSFVSGRYRGGCGYCDGANNYFQSLTADGAKASLWALAKACYATPGHVLEGSFLVNFIHDETLFEVPTGSGELTGPAIAEIMVGVMQDYTPDVPAIADPVVMPYWRKG